MELKHIVGFLCLIGWTGCLIDACSPIPDQCQLPACQCPDVIIPTGLAQNKTPQIVFVTFDDAINVVNYPLYEEIFFNRLNPNGHPVTTTLYVSHEYTDYTLANDLWRRGYELGIHSITHSASTDYWKSLNQTGWLQEVVEHKQLIAAFANIPETDVKGMRAPFLQTGGDIMMQVIYGEFEYDCSRPTLSYIDPGLWPYTLDYDTDFQDCQIAPCAVGEYPGFWNIPMVDLIGNDGTSPCAMLDQCLPPPASAEEVMDLLTKNFLRSYENNRAPFGLFTHAAWLSDLFPGRKQGYIQFLDYLGTLEDVYILSVERGLEWFKNPTSLDDIQEFTPWQRPERPENCNAYNCRFGPEDTPFGSERYMMSCRNCPPKYPWLGNPLGNELY